MRRLRIFLDANVLVDAQLRDLFLSAAEAELVDLVWSRRILDEFRKALIERLNVERSKVVSLTEAMSKAFPSATFSGFEEIEDSLQLPDPDDRHVLAAALCSESDLLVTSNLRDFPDKALRPEDDLAVVSPDEAIRLIVSIAPADMNRVVEAILRRLARPALTLDRYLERLGDRAPVGALALGAALDHTSSMEAYLDLQAAEEASTIITSAKS